ncbi:unnamed protein product [Caenorhabditis angaria]|uniref:Cubilin n=1 Tax=Caenorhabditis angaria TaxID=860376 RepID=A0A9P1N8Z2_9PELO|nr:unnamed protein product [Caenorhabditis angaria]
MKLLLFILVFILLFQPGELKNQRKHAVMLTENGNIFFQAGLEGNISFIPHGGSIFIGKTDLLNLPPIEEFEEQGKRIEALERYYKFLNEFDLSGQFRILEGKAEFLKKHNKHIEESLPELTEYMEESLKEDADIERELLELDKQITRIENIVNKDYCEEDRPCKNGATCVPNGILKYVCLCLKGFEGENCESDINECDFIKNTDLECQNNGTCVNTPGSYQCNCADNFFGPLCNSTAPICSPSSNLCGPNGYCIEKADLKSYTCSCDHGYRKTEDIRNPTCVDVNECSSNPCSPGIECVNIPGSYFCHGCPIGFKMSENGCVDIDECKTRHNPCDPLVECRNLIGSYECSPCPIGYSGDSRRRCSKIDPCFNNNCPESAKCITSDHILNPDGYVCVCPRGYYGERRENSTILGECVKSSNYACENEPCANGASCYSYPNDTYSCVCVPGYIGKNCEKISPCYLNSKCGNNGDCKVIDDDNFICQCHNFFFGEYCEYQEDSFDHHITDLNGRYSFNIYIPPGSRKQVRNLYFDAYHSDKMLHVQFITFYGFDMMEHGATNCTKTLGNLTVFDGPRDGYTQIAVFCGDREGPKGPESEPILFTTSLGLIRFEGVSGNYSIRYWVKERECGFRSTRPFGELIIPDYNTTKNCKWTITAPSSKVIEISVPNYEFYASRCIQNQLKIFENFKYDEYSRILLECQKLDAYKYRSTGPIVNVVFVVPRKPDKLVTGFSISYRIVEPETRCGFDIFNDKHDPSFSGIIKYPDFNGLYPPLTTCTWRIGSAGKNEMRSDFSLKLTVVSVDIPSEQIGDSVGEMCTTDYLRIYPDDPKYMSEFCDLITPFEQRDIGHNIMLQFHSDETIQGKGFEIEYEVNCGKTIVVPNAFRSFNYPFGGNTGSCSYSISGFYRQPFVMIIFKDIRLDILSNEDCLSSNEHSDYPNYVEIDGHKYFCEKDLFKTGNTMYINSHTSINVVSDGNPDFKGISVEVRETDDGCGGHFSGPGHFATPNFPEKYGKSKKCVFVIQPINNQRLSIEFKTFDVGVKTGEKCLGDRLELLDFHSTIPFISLCGYEIPERLEIDEKRKFVFTANDQTNMTSKGFIAEITIIQSPTVIQEFNHTLSSGSIDFRNTANQHIQQIHHIKVQTGFQIIFRLDFNIVTCKSFTLFIIDDQDSSILYKSECESSNLPVVYSSGNIATVNISINGDGVTRLSYQQYLGNCGEIHGYRGAISTPRYPNIPEGQCQWDISVADGNRVKVNVIFEVKCSNEGPFLDFIETTFDEKWSHATYCADSIPHPSTTSIKSNHLQLKYRPNKKKSELNSAFLVYYETNCQNVELIESFGSIQSPGYPDEEIDNQSCDWRIRVPLGNRIEVHVQEFVMDGCRLSYLEVSGMSHAILDDCSNETNISKFCDSTKPKIILSTSNVLNITYQTAYETSNRFWIKYSTIGCVENIYNSRDIIIKLDDVNSDEFECQYWIHTEPGKKILVTINEFNYKPEDENCIYRPDRSSDYKGFVWFQEISKIPEVQLCEPVSNYTFESHMDKIFLKMRLSKTHIKGSTVLNATVRIVDEVENDPCNAVVKITDYLEHRVTSPNYPHLFPPGIHCTWKYMVDEGYHLEIIFEELNTLNTSDLRGNDCAAELMGEIDLYKDSDKSLSNRISSTCQFEVDEPYAILSNTSILKFSNEISINPLINETVGFVASFRRICGGIFESKGFNSRFSVHLDDTCIITFKNSDESAGSMIYAKLESISFHKGQYYYVIDSGPKESIDFLRDGPWEFKAHRYIAFHFLENSGKILTFTFGPEKTSCGGELLDQQSIVEILSKDHPKSKALHCTWDINSSPGNHIELNLNLHQNPTALVNCSDNNYIEIYDKTSNKILPISCDSKQKFEAESLKVTLRYIPDEFSNGPNIRFDYEKVGGGETNSRIISPPIPRSNDEKEYEWVVRVDDEKMNGILIKVSNSYFAKNSKLEFSEVFDNGENGSPDYMFNHKNQQDQEFILTYLNVKIRARIIEEDDFKITWEPVPKPSDSENIPSNLILPKCNGQLTPSFTTQSIIRPVGEHRCVWTIVNPSIYGISVKLKNFILGSGENLNSVLCVSEYLEFFVDGKNYGKNRLCREDYEIPETLFDFKKYNKIEIVYTSIGEPSERDFVIQYQSICQIEAKIDGHLILSHPIIESKDELDCTYRIKSKNRKKNLVVTATKIDMQLCDQNNSLTIRDYHHWQSESFDFCINSSTKIFESGSLIHIDFKTTTPQVQHFQIRIEEKIVDCSDETYRLTNDIPFKIINSPNFPNSIPQGLNCKYPITVPHGKRVMLSFDPDNFDLAVSGNGRYILPSDDHLMVYDGISENDRVIGKYKGHHAPSTIFSTSNSMLILLHTEHGPISQRFIANVSIATCGGTIVVKDSETISIKSPEFRAGRNNSCQWNVVGLHSHMLDVRVSKYENLDCKKDKLLIHDGNSTADLLLPMVCKVDLEYETSFSSQITISSFLESHGSFEILVKLSERGCGGDITNDSGEIFAPGYPNRLLPRVKCVWNLRAEIGFVYDLKFKFIDTTEYSPDCYGNLWLLERYDPISVLNSHRGNGFCVDKSVLQTSTDSSVLLYDDDMSRHLQYRPGNSGTFSPFLIEYTKVQNNNCSKLITSNYSFNSTNSECKAIHLKIKNSDESSTVVLTARDPKNEKGWCYGENYVVQTNAPIQYYQKTCQGMHPSRTFLFINDEIDVFAKFGKFYFDIVYYDCGGLIKSPNSGQIMGSKNSTCLWLLEAPENMKIKLIIKELEIEHLSKDCKTGLKIGEGNEAKLNVIQDLCTSLENESFEVTSRSRHLQVQWQCDLQNCEFVMEYEFIGAEDTCGFSTSEMEGVIHLEKYEPNQNCVWNIQVPEMHHIKFTYQEMNLEDSKNCVEDRLEFQEKVDSETDTNIHCGKGLPIPHETSSNFAMFNFTAGSRNNSNLIIKGGFKIYWEAICGQVLTSSEGVIHSPDYPYYPNIDQKCGYVIKGNTIDLDLDLINLGMSDYIEIIDSSLKVFLNITGRSYYWDNIGTSQRVKGPIEIIFNKHFVKYRETTSHKSFKGFKIKYQVVTWGGELDATNFIEQIESPDFENIQKINYECLWKIYSTSERDFVLDSFGPSSPVPKDCGKNMLEILDENKTLIRKECSEKGWSKIRIPGPQFFIKFTINDPTIVPFQLNILPILPANCDQVLIASTDNWNVITPPTNHSLAINQCVWRINANADEKIRIKYGKNGCGKLVGKSLKEIEDQKKYLFSLNEKCDGDNEVDVVMEDNPLFLVYQDNLLIRKEFNISYIAVKTASQNLHLIATNSIQTINLNSTQLQSHSHKINIEEPTNQPIYFDIKIQGQICLTISNLGNPIQCEYRFCSSKNQLSGKICASGEYVSSSNDIDITTFPNGAENELNIKFHVIDFCNRTINITQHFAGSLESSKKPFCSTKLIGERQMLLVFEELQMNSTSCDLQIFSGNGEKLEAEVCSTMIPDAILGIQYKASYFSVWSQESDHIIFFENSDPQGIINSFKFTPNIRQRFMITPHNRKQCTLTFMHFTIQKCEPTSLTIKLRSKNGERIMAFCELPKNPIITDEPEGFEIYFDPSITSNDDSFRIQWKCE